MSRPRQKWKNGGLIGSKEGTDAISGYEYHTSHFSLFTFSFSFSFFSFFIFISFSIPAGALFYTHTMQMTLECKHPTLRRNRTSGQDEDGKKCVNQLSRNPTLVFIAVACYSAVLSHLAKAKAEELHPGIP
jgi:hypothetical protein